MASYWEIYLKAPKVTKVDGMPNDYYLAGIGDKSEVNPMKPNPLRGNFNSWSRAFNDGERK